MYNRTEANYSERLKRATKIAFKVDPTGGWTMAKERAKNYLHDVLNIYPSTPAIMRNFRWVQRVTTAEGIVNAFRVFHAEPAST